MNSRGSLSRLAGAYLVVLLALSGLGQVASTEEPVVRVLGYSGYIDYEALRIFEERTGVRVVYDEYDDSGEAWSKLEAGGQGYDLIIVSQAHVRPAIDRGLVRGIEKGLIPNLGLLDPRIAGHPADPLQEYAVPYMWGTTGIAYVEGCVDEPPSTWAEFFSLGYLEGYRGRVSLLQDFTEVVSAAMIALGLDPSDESSWSEESMRRVSGLLLEVKGYLAGFYDSSQYAPALASGEICLAQARSVDALAARGANEKVSYILPEDGALFWVDYLVIPRGAENVEEAHMLINFLLEPEIASRNVKAALLASAVDREALEEYAAAAGDEELLEILGDPAVYPPSQARLVPSPVLGERAQKLVEGVRAKVLAPVAGLDVEEGERGLIAIYLAAGVSLLAVMLLAIIVWRRQQS